MLAKKRIGGNLFEALILKNIHLNVAPVAFPKATVGLHKNERFWPLQKILPSCRIVAPLSTIS